MLGRTSEDEVCQRVTNTRYQDALRALGLVPLPEGAAREQGLLRRYQAIQAFVRTSRKFGSQRQASEKLAARIAMDNLARTAGYPDPIRLQWAMEDEAIRDLAEAPQEVRADGVTVVLALDDEGEAVVTVTKAGKRLKNVPAKAKKAPEVAALLARKQEIQGQASRMRLALEQAMCRADPLSGSELRTLMAHPVLAPMLDSLLLIGEGIAGYAVEQGRALQSHDGMLMPVGNQEQVRIAHPYDFRTYARSMLTEGERSCWRK